MKVWVYVTKHLVLFLETNNVFNICNKSTNTIETSPYLNSHAFSFLFTCAEVENKIYEKIVKFWQCLAPTQRPDECKSPDIYNLSFPFANDALHHAKFEKDWPSKW